MVFEVGFVDNIKCPNCGEENTFDDYDCESIIEDDILTIRTSVECENCNSLFKVCKRYMLEFLDCTVQEGELKPKLKQKLINYCPPNVFLCSQCPNDNTGLCPYFPVNTDREV